MKSQDERQLADEERRDATQIHDESGNTDGAAMSLTIEGIEEEMKWMGRTVYERLRVKHDSQRRDHS